jgi:hypothetical protein
MQRGYRMSPFKKVDLTIGRKFSLSKGVSAQLNGTIFNVLNTGNEWEFATLVLSEGEIFTPDAWTKPRRLSVQLGLQF